jgi:hypothetical protein
MHHILAAKTTSLAKKYPASLFGSAEMRRKTSLKYWCMDVYE